MSTVEKSGKKGRVPVRPGRHPAVIGAFEAARVLLFLLVVALVLSAIAWFIGIAQQRPLSAMVSWAATGIASTNGFTITVDSFTHSLSPTALTLIAWLLICTAARRTARALGANDRLVSAGQLSGSSRPRLAAGLGLIGTYGLVTVAVSFLIGGAVVDVLGPLRFGLLLLTAVLAGLDLGSASAAVADWLAATVGPRWAEAIATGSGIFRRVALLLIALGGLAVLAVIVLGWGPAIETLQIYSAPTMAAIGLGLVQTVFAPTLLMLALAWVSGAGFHLASGVITSPFQTVDAPVASIPMLAAVPQAPAAWMAVLPAAVVLVGMLAVLARRSWNTDDWAAAVITGAEVFIAALVVGLFCRGALGPGGLDDFGIRPWTFAGLVAAEVTGGLLIGWGMLRLAGRHRVSPDTADPSSARTTT